MEHAVTVRNLVTQNNGEHEKASIPFVRTYAFRSKGLDEAPCEDDARFQNTFIGEDKWEVSVIELPKVRYRLFLRIRCGVRCVFALGRRECEEVCLAELMQILLHGLKSCRGSIVEISLKVNLPGCIAAAVPKVEMAEPEQRKIFSEPHRCKL